MSPALGIHPTFMILRIQPTSLTDWRVSGSTAIWASVLYKKCSVLSAGWLGAPGRVGCRRKRCQLVSPLEVSNEIPPAPAGPQSWHHY